MIVFTILGVLVFWYAMGLTGYFLGVFIDLRRGLIRLTAPVDKAMDEITALLAIFAAYNSSKDQGAPHG